MSEAKAIPWVPRKTIDWPKVQQILSASEQSGHFTNGGPVVKQLEAFLHKHLDIAPSKEVVCVSNGAVALWAAAAALELQHQPQKPLRWATQAFTFPPSAQGFLRDALILDIDEEGGLDLSQVPLTEVDGIIVTNVFGNTTDTQKYAEWAHKHQKFLLFDNAATAFSMTQQEEGMTNINNVGHAATLSFHHTKPLGFGEGGAVILDKALVPYIRRVVNFGIDNDAPHPTWDRAGSNYKMSDIAAAFILQYLDGGNLEAIRAHHQTLYAHALTRLPHTIRPFPTKDPQPFVACLALLMDPCQSLEAQQRLQKNGIFSRKYYRPLADLQKATALFDRILCVPLHRDMSEADVDRMLDIVVSGGHCDETD